MMQFKKARLGDADTLAKASERAFHSDIHCGAPGLGGPPGYNSAAWQARMMRLGDYYKIVVEGQIVGGVIVFRKRAREYELGRIFVDPDFQNRGMVQPSPMQSVFAYTYATNKTEMRALEKAGLEEKGGLPDPYYRVRLSPEESVLYLREKGH